MSNRSIKSLYSISISPANLARYSTHAFNIQNAQSNYEHNSFAIAHASYASRSIQPKTQSIIPQLQVFKF
ncbi:hypothetical protein EYC80_005024 [Monilinia laxa]|uniref:Uncharacterized protein n=1 Tax=Monilinia laxa TaxID=61186 RepID=A0A5N6KIZ1_MONLA|nr:hypothetical protein EYC80_005024 [Monilinia laxa]